MTGGAWPGEVLFDRGYTRLRRCRHGLTVYPLTDRFVGWSLDRYGEFSQGEADLFRQLVKPGQVVAEIGANIGAHTAALAAMVGPGGGVLALEPQRVLFQMLCANVALAGHTNVHTHHAAAGREEGHILVPNIDYGAEGNFGGVTLGEYEKGARVRVARLDDFGLGACHFLKIDVEGMEGEVIAGAAETIRAFRPVLYVENDRREKSASLIAQLFGLGYRLYWHLPPLFNPDNFLANPENVFGRIVSVNMLCLPEERPRKMANFRAIESPDDWWKPGS